MRNRRSFEKMILGAAVAVSSAMVLPFLKKTLPNIPDRAKYMMQIAREEVEDIIAEAQFERMRRKIDREIAGQ